MTGHAVRMLALAVSESPVDANGIPDNLILIGLAGIRDEVRPEARKAVCEIRGAGIQVVMITGDSRETASAIAREAGLLTGREAGAVLTSAELGGLTDEQLKSGFPPCGSWHGLAGGQKAAWCASHRRWDWWPG